MTILEQKAQIVAEIKENFEKSQSAVLIDYKGLTVAEVTKMRNDFREAGVNYKVYKNTLIRRAAEELKLDGISEVLAGTTAIAFGVDDAVAPAKIVTKYIKDFKKMEIKIGVVEGKVIDVAGVEELAKLPSKEELVAKMLGSMNAPITNFVGVLSGTIRALCYTINAIADSKKEQEA